MNSFGRIGSYVKMLLRSDNVYIFTIVNYFTKEGHIL
jgi:hypothetical protein